MHQHTRAPLRTALHRLSLRTAGAVAITLATLGGAKAATSTADTIKAYKLCTGADNASHVLHGTIDQNMRNDVTSIHFKQSPAHASYDWHNDPEPQYVITLSGTLAFATRNGETFTLHPGEVLVAEDNTGTSPGCRVNFSPLRVANARVPDSVMTYCGSGSLCQS